MAEQGAALKRADYCNVLRICVWVKQPERLVQCFLLPCDRTLGGGYLSGHASALVAQRGDGVIGAHTYRVAAPAFVATVTWWLLPLDSGWKPKAGGEGMGMRRKGVFR